MFKDYQKEKPGFLEILNKIILIIPVVLVFIVGVSLITYFSGQLSTKDKKALQVRNEKEKAFLSSISVVVRDAGYVRRNIESGEMYIPGLLVQVTNTESKPRDRMLLLATFRKGGRSFCSGSVSIFPVLSAESRDVEIKCLESTGFGTIAKGMSLIETTEPLTYELWLESGDLSVKVAEGSFSFKILSFSRPAHLFSKRASFLQSMKMKKDIRLLSAIKSSGFLEKEQNHNHQPDFKKREK